MHIYTRYFSYFEYPSPFRNMHVDMCVHIYDIYIHSRRRTSIQRPRTKPVLENSINL